MCPATIQCAILVRDIVVNEIGEMRRTGISFPQDVAVDGR